MPSDREQLEFLMSQAIDGQLSAEQAVGLERQLAGDPSARAEFERMKRLSDLLGRWGRQTVPVDPERVEQVLSDRVRDDAEYAISRMLDGDEQAERDLVAYGRRDPHVGLLEYKYEKLECLLRGWGRLEPAVDHERFYQRLCETIHAEAAQSRRRVGRTVLRLYAPLAAAAAVALVAGLWWVSRGPAPQPSVGPARIEVAFVGPPAPTPKAKPVMAFSFGLSPDAPIQATAKAANRGGSGTILSFGGVGVGVPTPSKDLHEMIF